jgi:hypothetical protein
MKFPPGIQGQKFGESLNGYFIRMPGPNENGEAKISVNETCFIVNQNILLMLLKIRSIKQNNLSNNQTFCMRKIFIAAILLSSTVLFAQKDASVSFEKWISLKTYGSPVISPDGKIIVYGVSGTDWANNLMTMNFGW